MKRFWLVTALLVALQFLVCRHELVLGDDPIADAIAVIAKVGPGAAGSGPARKAADELAKQNADVLPQLLNAMDTTNVVAANWYRTAFDSVAERELAKSNAALPRSQIEAFVRDAKRNGRARRLGFALLQRMDLNLAERWMPTWLEDAEFRRDAVDHVMQLGDRALTAKQAEQARTHFEQAFQFARDSDQVTTAVRKLKSVGKEVDVIAHLGFVIRWKLVGPFAAPDTSGFRSAFPPEKQVNLKAEYTGADGKLIGWKLHQTSNAMGEVNLIQAIGAVKESVGYAFTEIDSPQDQQVQLRCSADDNLTVWLNGQQVLAREQWLNGTRLDRFVVPVTLRKGTNQVLVKICQGPQHVNPEVPNNWTFQVRFCDESGAGVKFKTLLEAAESP